MTQSNLSRRDFLRLNTAALAGLAAVPGVFPKTKTDAGRIAENASPGFYRFSFGEMEITVPSDGQFEYSPDFVTIDDPVEIQACNAEPESRDKFFRSRRLPNDRIPLQTSPVLIDSGNHRTLIDCGFGAGEQVPPTAGHLKHSLEAAGIAPDSIDSVLLTHAHPDHMGGFLNPQDGTPVFPESKLVISEKEYEF